MFRMLCGAQWARNCLSMACLVLQATALRSPHPRPSAMATSSALWEAEGRPMLMY